MTTFLGCSNDITEYEFKSRLNLESNREESCEESYEFDSEDEYEHDCECTPIFEGNLRTDDSLNEANFDIDSGEEDPMSTLVHVIDQNGEKKLIRKSTYLWMITEPGVKLSNDRTLPPKKTRPWGWKVSTIRNND